MELLTLPGAVPHISLTLGRSSLYSTWLTVWMAGEVASASGILSRPVLLVQLPNSSLGSNLTSSSQGRTANLRERTGHCWNGSSLPLSLPPSQSTHSLGRWEGRGERIFWCVKKTSKKLTKRFQERAFSFSMKVQSPESGKQSEIGNTMTYINNSACYRVSDS